MILFIFSQSAIASTHACQNLFSTPLEKINPNPNVKIDGEKFILADELYSLFDFVTTRHYNAGQIKSSLVLKMFQGLPEVMDPARVLFLESDVAYFRNMTDVKALQLLDEITVKGDYSKLIELVKKLELNRTKVFRLIDFIASSPTHRYQTQKYGSLIRSGETENQKIIKIEGVFKSIQEAAAEMETRWAKNEESEIEYLKITLGNLMSSTLRIDRDSDEAFIVAVRRLKSNLEEQTKVRGDPRIMVYLAKSLFKNLDPHSEFYAALEAEKANFGMSRKKSIGIHPASVKDGILITRVIKESLAEKAGLKQGDVIVDINGKSTTEILDTHLALFMSLQQEDTVNLRIKRESLMLEVDIDRSISESLSHDQIETSIKTLGDGTKIAAIRFGVFYRGVGTDFKKELIQLMAQGVNGLVIDLRSNGGGSLVDATQILKLFTDSKEILWNIKFANKRETNHDGESVSTSYFENYNRMFYGPLVVLIDNASASASELSASTLKALGKAIVVGAPQSFGKGSMQDTSNTEIGSYRITEALFFNGEGYSPQFYGVPSDVVIRGAERDLTRSMEKDIPGAIQPDPLFKVNQAYSHVSTSVISELPLLRGRSLQRQKDIEKSESTDPVLDESFSILSDWIELLKK